MKIIFVLLINPDDFDECMYVVTKVKEMPKLHRAVWRGDLIKVKSIGNGIRKTVLNTRDKEYRFDYGLPLRVDKIMHA